MWVCGASGLKLLQLLQLVHVRVVGGWGLRKFLVQFVPALQVVLSIAVGLNELNQPKYVK